MSYSTSTWKRSNYTLSNSETSASDYAPDPVTGKVYCCARKNNPNEWLLVNMDVSTKPWEPSVIAVLECCLSGMAVDNEGQIYAV